MHRDEQHCCELSNMEIIHFSMSMDVILSLYFAAIKKRRQRMFISTRLWSFARRRTRHEFRNRRTIFCSMARRLSRSVGDLPSACPIIANSNTKNPRTKGKSSKTTDTVSYQPRSYQLDICVFFLHALNCLELIAQICVWQTSVYYLWLYHQRLSACNFCFIHGLYMLRI